MYQTVGHHAIELYAEAMDLPLYRRTIQGLSLNTGRNYTATEGDEVEDLYELLNLVKVGLQDCHPITPRVLGGKLHFDHLQLQKLHTGLNLYTQKKQTGTGVPPLSLSYSFLLQI